MRQPRLFGRPRGLTIFTWGLLVVLGILSVYPTVTLLAGAFRSGSPFFGQHGFSLEGFATAFGSPESLPPFRNSIILALFTAVVGTGFGFLFAWLSARTTVPLGRLLTPIMVVTVALPSLFIAMSWAVLANERAGVINQFWQSLTGRDEGLFDIYSWPGLVALSVIKPIAIAYLLLLGPCKGLGRAIEEAAVTSGTGPLGTLVRITVPVLAPTILAVSVINLIIGLEAFDIPTLIAFPADIPLLPLEVYRYIHDSIPANYPASSALALAICVVILVLVAMRQRLVSRHSYATVTGKALGDGRWHLGRLAPVFGALIVMYAVLALLLPLAQLVVGSFQPLFGSFRVLSTANYDAVLRNPDTLAAIGRSLAVGVGGGLLAMLFTLAVSYVVRHAGGRIQTRILDIATWLPAALPGVVLGLALSWAYLSLPFLRPLYGSAAMLVIALMVAGIPLAARASEGGLVQIHRELEEAARISGANRVRSVGGVLVPLITPSFLAGWLLTSLYLAGRLDVPILLSTPRNRLAIVSVYELYSNGRTGEAAAVFCLLLLGFAVVAGVLALAAVLARRFTTGVTATVPGPSRDVPTGTHSPTMVEGANNRG